VRRAGAALLGPYTLLQLAIGVVTGAVWFGEPPDLPGGAGVLLILASCLMSSGLPSPRARRLAAA
jgi:drug/metabolite transporter (DMT)-like permease